MQYGKNRGLLQNDFGTLSQKTGLKKTRCSPFFQETPTDPSSPLHVIVSNGAVGLKFWYQTQ